MPVLGLFAVLCIFHAAQAFISAPLRPKQHLSRWAADPAQTLDEKKDDDTTYFTIKTHNRLDQIPKSDWDSLVGPGDSPFLEYDWLWCMEESGCASPETGWNPLHLTVRSQSSDDPDSHEAGEIVAAVPCYIVTHSMGQFIFDNSWADAAYRMGIKYYPKLLVAVPFTPAGTQRILLKKDLPPRVQTELQRMVGGFLGQVAAQNNISSVHFNFCGEDEVEALNDAGYLPRKTMQFHFHNQHPERPGQKYTSFDDYLNIFKSKRRSKIRKELRSVSEAGLTIRTYTGEQIPDRLFDEDIIYDLYTTTIQKMYFGRQYLNAKFFTLLKDRFRRNLVLILAEDQKGEVVGGTINVAKAGRFYGRYWGSFKHVDFLHFVCCYYSSVDYCIRNGLDVMEAGAGASDDYKFLRGYDAAVQHSAHFLVDGVFRRMVADFLDYETRQIAANAEYLNEESAIGKARARVQQPEEEEATAAVADGRD